MFKKDEKQKLRYDLIPPDTLADMAKVLTMGAEKYGANTWKNPDSPHYHEAAALRHIQAWRMGESLDEESGLPHLIHAITNLMFLYENGF